MKVFISHKMEDFSPALAIKHTFDKLGVDAYLDLLDSSVEKDGEKLTEHLKSKLNTCTDIIVVISEKTRLSWWVPFEIGMASQANLPIANYLISSVQLPEYLESWPRLKSVDDITKYVSVRQKIRKQMRETYPFSYSKQIHGPIEVATFYKSLKEELR